MSWPMCGVKTIDRGVCKATVLDYDPKGNIVHLEIRKAWPTPVVDGEFPATISFWAPMSSLTWINTEAANQFNIPNVRVIGVGYKGDEKLRIYEESKKS